ncbi:MAG: hypothetical protein HY040_16135 [Planctomycetes bacterium]|nr:hypothetical protein [Planctomycetota bacterium]
MKRKRFVVFLLVLVVVAFGIWLEPTRVAWGWLRGEAFYQGRPTSWWSSELRKWERHSVGGSILVLVRDGGWNWAPKPWYRLLPSRLHPTLDIRQCGPRPALFRWTPEARDVLKELLEDSEPMVQLVAAEGLEELGEKQSLERLINGGAR